MHHTHPDRWHHLHQYAHDSSLAERRTRVVIGITATMMVVEIVGGVVFHSMAVLADGWHMGTHVSAFLITAVAYYFAHRNATDPHYSFGTGKIGALGRFCQCGRAFRSGVSHGWRVGLSHLRSVADSIQRRYRHRHRCAACQLDMRTCCSMSAIPTTIEHAHGHDGHDHHHDLNLRAAYLHVLADAFTTLAAIFALLGGKFFGWSWLDPVVGLAGSAVVFSWAYSLLRVTSGILLDRTPESSDLPDEIRRAVECDGDSVVTDLHIWQVSAGKFAAIVSIVAHEPKSPEAYRELFREHEELVHVTVEIQQCQHNEEAHANA